MAEKEEGRKVSLNSNNAQLEWNNRTLPDIIHCSLPIKETAGTSIFQNGRREVYTPLFFNRNTYSLFRLARQDESYSLFRAHFKN